MNSPVRTAATHGAVQRRVPKVAYVLDPRFPGGTSAAVARELETIWAKFKPQIFGISSKMFTGQTVAPSLANTLRKIGANLIWDPKTIQADVVIFHNPSFLKFQARLECNIVAQKLFVVTHENFTRPGGALGFDVAGCLDQINRASIAVEKFLVPVSPHNRETVKGWLEQQPGQGAWDIFGENWFNICDFTMSKPTAKPSDRRGRLSRPGFEKFPSLTALEKCFTKRAESNIILGADTFMAHAHTHPHWTLIPFNGIEVSAFFEDIDFMVYFTSPSWRESFGRVVAEATAAGKIVIADSATAENFGDGVIGTVPEKVDELIAGFVGAPNSYGQQVRLAQESLRQFGSDQFGNLFQSKIAASQGASK